MSLQSTITNAIRRHGQPAKLCWEASTALDLSTAEIATASTSAYVVTQEVRTATGGTERRRLAYLPVLARSIVGATLTIGKQSWRVIDAKEFIAGNRGTLMQEAVLS